MPDPADFHTQPFPIRFLQCELGSWPERVEAVFCRGANNAKSLIGNIGYFTGIADVTFGIRTVQKQATYLRMKLDARNGPPWGTVDDHIALDRRQAPQS
jgi:hypothetical protein